MPALRERAGARSGVVPGVRCRGGDRGGRGAGLAGAAVSGRWARRAGGDRRDPGDRRAREPERRRGAEPDGDAGTEQCRAARRFAEPAAHADAAAEPTASPDPNATPTATVSPDPNDPNATPTPTRERDRRARPSRPHRRIRKTDGGTGSTFPDWTGTDGIHDHHRVQHDPGGRREGRARRRVDDGENDVGILESERVLVAQRRLLGRLRRRVQRASPRPRTRSSDVKADYSDAYVRKVRSSTYAS